MDAIQTRCETKARDHVLFVSDLCDRKDMSTLQNAHQNKHCQAAATRRLSSPFTRRILVRR